MKKIMICLVAMVTCFFLALGTAKAAQGSCTDSGACTVGSTTLDLTCSKNVTINYNSGAQSYAANASHRNGDTVYGAASNSSKFYKTTKDAGSEYTTAPGASDSSAFSNWSEM